MNAAELAKAQLRARLRNKIRYQEMQRLMKLSPDRIVSVEEVDDNWINLALEPLPRDHPWYGIPLNCWENIVMGMRVTVDTRLRPGELSAEDKTQLRCLPEGWSAEYRLLCLPEYENERAELKTNVIPWLRNVISLAKKRAEKKLPKLLLKSMPGSGACWGCARMVTREDWPFVCDGCKVAFFCSAACAQEAQQTHFPQCQILCPTDCAASQQAQEGQLRVESEPFNPDREYWLTLEGPRFKRLTQDLAPGILLIEIKEHMQTCTPQVNGVDGVGAAGGVASHSVPEDGGKSKSARARERRKIAAARQAAAAAAPLGGGLDSAPVEAAQGGLDSSPLEAAQGGLDSVPLEAGGLDSGSFEPSSTIIGWMEDAARDVERRNSQRAIWLRLYRKAERRNSERAIWLRLYRKYTALTVHRKYAAQTEVLVLWAQFALQSMWCKVVLVKRRYASTIAHIERWGRVCEPMKKRVRDAVMQEDAAFHFERGKFWREKAAALEEERVARQCAVCMEAECNIVLLPCKHQCVCAGCAPDLRDCPLCRAVVTERLQVFVN